MKSRRIPGHFFVLPVLLLLTVAGLVQAQAPPVAPARQAPLGTAFTYQGQLKMEDEPVNATCELAFRLYDAAIAGSQVGTALTETVVVSDGLFTQPLDFGADAFSGDARWLDIAVLCPGDTGFTDLGRQALTAAPYAHYALSTGALHGAPITTTAPITGQVLAWDGVVWEPRLDADTTYTAGNQLALSGTTFHVLEGSGSGLDADLLDGQEGAAYQQRVSGTCVLGSTVRAINPDGSVVCEPHNTRPGYSLNTLDSTGDAGRHTSLIIGTDGLALISYYDASQGDLKVAHCHDVACTGATTTTLDSAGDVGYDTSITIGADGLGLISYLDWNNRDLKVAHCHDVACTGATITTLDSAGDVGYDTSITIGADGLGLISYYDATNRDLKVAHCHDAACTGATVTTLDSAGNVGLDTSITIGTDGLGLISYYDTTNLEQLKVAHCDDLPCTAATVSILDKTGHAGRGSSITIGADGLPLISYHRWTLLHDSLKVAHCNNVACTGATLVTLDVHIGMESWETALTIGADGLPLIGYYEANNDILKVAHCNDIACTDASLMTLDSAGDVGAYPSLTIGADGLPLLSYYDNTNDDLKVLHCSNPFCVPYFRRR
ncbi:MAG: hypothetical protein ACLFU8_18160 [Anaerolineales bacterium]